MRISWRGTAAITAALLVTASGIPAAHGTSTGPWPAHGQAAYVLGDGPMRASGSETAQPIASVAKVMTAYLVLRERPLRPHSAGFRLRVSAHDVRDYRHRLARGESVVPVAAGEVLTERQALAALLLPSANNVAIMLARRLAGSVHRFAVRMNATARRLGMRHTVYTDPSGFDATTRSTAIDQTRLARVAMRIRAFAAYVSRTHIRIPVAGTVRNTDRLLGRDGFVGIKTGSMDASGGCFMFRSRRIVHGHLVAMTGVVLGQPGSDLIGAGLDAAKRLVDRVAPHAGRS